MELFTRMVLTPLSDSERALWRTLMATKGMTWDEKWTAWCLR